MWVELDELEIWSVLVNSLLVSPGKILHITNGLKCTVEMLGTLRSHMEIDKHWNAVVLNWSVILRLLAPLNADWILTVAAIVFWSQIELHKFKISTDTDCLRRGFSVSEITGVVGNKLNIEFSRMLSLLEVSLSLNGLNWLKKLKVLSFEIVLRSPSIEPSIV